MVVLISDEMGFAQIFFLTWYSEIEEPIKSREKHFIHLCCIIILTLFIWIICAPIEMCDPRELFELINYFREYFPGTFLMHTYLSSLPSGLFPVVYAS